ncbi:MAG: adenylate cyclase, class 2 [Candidatus Parcubacteria bacterium]|jgi:adenylate cyclase class 2|nr:adenylate cyclase, class 2 [Candidatus Parcubacteria bacterium]
MTHEIETKVLDIDADAVSDALTALGAQKTQDTRLIVDWYRTKGDKEGEEPWFLRIRSNSAGKHEVTWKAKSDIIGIARKHKEINFFIDEPEKLANLFEELGLEVYAHQEKDRTSYTFKDWSFDIDRYPGMPPFLEIEGSSEEHIQEALVLLELGKNPTWATGERILIQERYGLDWYGMKF